MRNGATPAQPTAVLTAGFCALTACLLFLDAFRDTLASTDVPSRIVDLTSHVIMHLPKADT